MYVHAPVLDGERIGPHALEVAVNRGFDRIYSRQDAYQGHDPDSNNEGRKNGPEQLAPDTLQCDLDIFPEFHKNSGCEST